MALVRPQLAVSHVLGAPRAEVNTLELYLDYTCPFSARLFKTFFYDIKPIIEKDYPGKFHAIFKHQVQPWHPSSTLTHETALAVARLAPEKFWVFSAALFADQERYFDAAVINETRNDTYRRLSQLAADKTGCPLNEFYDLLVISDKTSNEGNKITNELKLHIKSARLSGIHVSPTVVFNGNRDDTISSGWSIDQWKDWLKDKVK